MSVLMDKCILFALILSLLLRGSVGQSIIAALIAALILSSLYSYLEGNGAAVISVIHCIAAFFWPPLAVFLPPAVYDCCSQKNLWRRFLWLLPLLRSVTVLDPVESLSCTVLSCLALLLFFRTARYECLLKEYHKVQDDTTEAALLLREQNKELMKNQDYEVELATLAERNRIAREIHDNVGHLLTRSILQVSALLVVHSKETELKGSLLAVKETLTDAMDNVRQSVHDLHGEAVDLKKQLTLLVEAFTFCPVQLVFDSGIMPKDMNYAVIAIVKEALSNIAHHSNATEAVISVLEHPSLYQLIISDNGTDIASPDFVSPHFLSDTTSLQTHGIGLSNMEERIRTFGGLIHIDRTKGFKIFISIPKGGKAK